MTRALLAALAVVSLAAGCVEDDTFHCLEDAQCGDGGACEANSVCSFEDGDCDSGWRYGQLAPSGIANVCVPPGEALAPIEDEPPEEEPEPVPSGCAALESCEACLACTVFDGPCAADVWTCSLDDTCLDGVTCGQTCLLTGVCDDCCATAADSQAQAIAATTACVASECADLCGAGFEPVCGAG